MGLLLGLEPRLPLGVGLGLMRGFGLGELLLVRLKRRLPLSLGLGLASGLGLG